MKRRNKMIKAPTAKTRYCLGIEGINAFGGKISERSKPPIAPPICAQMLTFPKEKR